MTFPTLNQNMGNYYELLGQLVVLPKLDAFVDKFKPIRLWAFLLVVMTLLPAVLPSSAGAAEPTIDIKADEKYDRKLKVLVSIAPLAHLVKDLTGAQIDVEQLLPASADLHHYAIKPSDLTRLEQADAFIWVGPRAESYLTTSVKRLRNTKIYDLSLESLSGIVWKSYENSGLHDKRSNTGHYHDGHGHGHGHGEHHSDLRSDTDLSLENIDPHIWLSIENRPVLIKSVAEWLISKLSNGSNSSTVINSMTLKQHRLIDTWERKAIEWRSLFDKPVNVLVDHNAYQYLLDELNLELMGIIQKHHEVKPSLKHLLQLSSIVKREKGGCLLQHPKTDKKLIRKIDPKQRLLNITIDPMMQNEQYPYERHQHEQRFITVDQMDHIVKQLHQCVSSA